jgi:hypothetical protein
MRASPPNLRDDLVRAFALVQVAPRIGLPEDVVPKQAISGRARAEVRHVPRQKECVT